MRTYLIILFAFFIIAQEAMAQRNRPSRGRTSTRTGSNSSSTGSSSSTVSGSSRSSYSGGSSSYNRPSSSRSSSSSWSSSSNSNSSYSSSNTHRTYAQRGRSRMRGRNTAPILAFRSSRYASRTLQSGNISALRSYNTPYGTYRVSTHTPISVFAGYSCYNRSRYNSSYEYHRSLNTRHIYRRNWVTVPTAFYYNDGLHCIDDYPYIVHTGYRHRYSTIELCDYELVDMVENKAIKSFYDEACNIGFDKCAAKRDQLNEKEESQRYLCLEKVDEDLSVEDNFDNIPSLISNLTPEQIKEIDELIENNNDKKMFRLARKGYKGCEITKSSNGNCNFEVRVQGKIYPFSDGSICSSTRTSPNLNLFGCNGYSQKLNATCLFELALSEGYCTKE